MAARTVRWTRSAMILVLMLILMNEFISHWIAEYKWPNFPYNSQRRKKDKELLILFVADPQLQGYLDEMSFPVGTITRWDADRYIQKTFDLVFNHYDPDVVVYLGDMLDEGSRASDEDYEDYFNRFNNVFKSAAAKTRIYLPGDNDIGGEGPDRRTKQKIDRFHRYFAPTVEVVNEDFVSFLKLDIQQNQIGERLRKVHHMEIVHPLRIVVDHESVLMKRKSTLFNLFNSVRPSVIFTGHRHYSMHWVCTGCFDGSPTDDIYPFTPVEMMPITSIDLNDKKHLHEIYVPTCSYRMGVEHMGYGLAHISSHGNLTYSVLWLPHRYRQLYYYLAVISIIVFIYIIRFFLFNRFSRRTPHLHR